MENLTGTSIAKVSREIDEIDRRINKQDNKFEFVHSNCSWSSALIYTQHWYKRKKRNKYTEIYIKYIEKKKKRTYPETLMKNNYKTNEWTEKKKERENYYRCNLGNRRLGSLTLRKIRHIRILECPFVLAKSGALAEIFSHLQRTLAMHSYLYRR